MIVGIDNTPLTSPHKVRGVGFYTKRLIKALGKIAKKDKAFSLKTGKAKDLISGVDLIHYPFFDPFFLTLPIIKKKPTVATVHDLVPLRFPNHFPLGIRGKLKWLLQRLSLKNAEAIITDSQTSKKDIVRFAGLKEDKVFVVYLAANKIFKPITDKQQLEKIRKKLKLPKKFVLYVGDLNFNKNVNLLAESCLGLKYPLVIVGKQAVDKSYDKSHPENQPLLNLQNLANKNPNKIIRLGFLETNLLVKVYNLATVYCQPSLAEGFGLPILEAMACGCPVVTSKKTSLSEIAGKAALLVNPSKPKELSQTLENCWTKQSVRMRLSKLGLKQAAKFSWEKTASQTLEVYKKVYD